MEHGIQPTKKLEYEPTYAGRPVVVDTGQCATRIFVPMTGVYVPVPHWMFDLDVLSIVVVPLAWITILIVRSSMRLRPPPRAEFTITLERVTVVFRDSASNRSQSWDWPRSAVIELRANRYDKGLWMNVAGHVKDTFLKDLRRETILMLEAELEKALKPEQPVTVQE